MSEAPNNPVERRRQIITSIVQKPVESLRIFRARGKEIADCLDLLRSTRSEIRKDPTYVIANPDPHFAQFYKMEGDTVDHYVALFTLLKGAGFSKIEISSVLMDTMPVGIRKGDTMSYDQGHAARVFLPLVNEALEKVFPAEV